MTYHRNFTANAKFSSTQSLNIIVLGYIIRGPLGGLAWHHLQYVLGLARMGHAVTFIEDSDDYDSCFDPISCEVGKDPTYGLEFARQSFSVIGLESCWAYHDVHTRTWFGPRANDALARCKDADILLNLSGVNPLRRWFDNIDTRVLIDTDPVFTQIKNIQDESARALAARHSHFFSFGENIARSDCTIPDDGIPWQPTRQPVVLDCWNNKSRTELKEACHFTSIMQWDSYPAREYGGVAYGMKSRSFQPFMDMPQKSTQRLELALGGETAPRDDLQALGWGLQDSLSVTRTIDTYRDYIAQSHAEFGISKHGYVVSKSGWFSERSANYLASGKPVVVQDTGFGEWLKTDLGVIAFNSPEEAVAALEDVHSDYKRHALAAREIASEYFCHNKVLDKLLDEVFASRDELTVEMSL